MKFLERHFYFPTRMLRGSIVAVGGKKEKCHTHALSFPLRLLERFFSRIRILNSSFEIQLDQRYTNVGQGCRLERVFHSSIPSPSPLFHLAHLSIHQLDRPSSSDLEWRDGRALKREMGLIPPLFLPPPISLPISLWRRRRRRRQRIKGLKVLAPLF